MPRVLRSALALALLLALSGCADGRGAGARLGSAAPVASAAAGIDFSPQGKPAEGVMRRWYGGGELP